MKTQLLLLIIALGCAWGQTKQVAKQPQKQAESAPVISSDDAPDDPPKFKRKYSAKLASKPGITLTVECADFIGERWCTATVRQPDEKYVSFRLDHNYAPGESIAGKIIDPMLVPELQRLTKIMHQMDGFYREANPSQWKDNDGSRWQKQAAK